MADPIEIPPYEGPEAHTDEELQRMAAEQFIHVSKLDRSEPSRWQRMKRVAKESRAGRLPPRYASDSWHAPYRPRVQTALRPGIRILDVGAGARPTVPPDERPEGCTYVGFDVDGEELRKAPAGSYDEIVVGDVCELQHAFIGRFDLVLTWLAMEHVKPVPTALENLSRYQAPGGRFLGYLSGGRSVHAVLNRLVPQSLAKTAMRRLLNREPDTVFRAYYDHCWYDALRDIADGAWARAEVIPIFTGGWYFAFSPLIRGAFLAYEEWAYTGGHSNLAGYYLIDGVA